MLAFALRTALHCTNLYCLLLLLLLLLLLMRRLMPFIWRVVIGLGYLAFGGSQPARGGVVVSGTSFREGKGPILGCGRLTKYRVGWWVLMRAS